MKFSKTKKYKIDDDTIYKPIHTGDYWIVQCIVYYSSNKFNDVYHDQHYDYRTHSLGSVTFNRKKYYTRNDYVFLSENDDILEIK